MTKTTTVVKSKFSPKDEFVAKKIGANLIVTIGKGKNEERYGKKVTLEEAELVMRKMVNYNKRPTEGGKATIIKLLTPEATKIKEEQEKNKAKAKGLKQQIKKETKKSMEDKPKRNILEEIEELVSTDDTAIPRLQAILDKFKKVEEAKPAPVAAKQRMTGEH